MLWNSHAYSLMMNQLVGWLHFVLCFLVWLEVAQHLFVLIFCTCIKDKGHMMTNECKISKWMAICITLFE
jgi:hypothetical protein